jgi:hypothetical protein
MTFELLKVCSRQANPAWIELRVMYVRLWFFSKKNILIPNVAEKNIQILVEEKKII